LTDPLLPVTDSLFTPKFMGQQINKIEKRRRRANYLARKKLKAKETAVLKSTSSRKKPAAKKKEAAEPAAA
jgi:hypothetical protein